MLRRDERVSSAVHSEHTDSQCTSAAIVLVLVACLMFDATVLQLSRVVDSFFLILCFKTDRKTRFDSSMDKFGCNYSLAVLVGEYRV